MKKLSKQTVKDYCKNPHFCPYCLNENIQIDEYGEGYNEVSCDNCGATWHETYTITGIEPVGVFGRKSRLEGE